MYTGQCLVKELHQERLKRAQEERTANQVAELRKLEKRQGRAERKLLRTWSLVERLRSNLEAAG